MTGVNGLTGLARTLYGGLGEFKRERRGEKISLFDRARPEGRGVEPRPSGAQCALSASIRLERLFVDVGGAVCPQSPVAILSGIFRGAKTVGYEKRPRAVAGPLVGLCEDHDLARSRST